MRSLIAFSCVLLLVSTAAARSLSAASPGGVIAAAAPRATSVAAALKSTPQLSILLEAVTAAGITIPADATWTILAPTNMAFEYRLKKDLNITADKLLLPQNKALLTRVLQYHVIPGGAVLSSQLKDNETFATALAGAAPLRVQLKTKDSKTYVKFVGATNSAEVIIPDIVAGNSVVHVVKDVLLPAGVGIAGDAEGWKAVKGAKMMMGEKGPAGAGGARMHMAGGAPTRKGEKGPAGRGAPKPMPGGAPMRMGEKGPAAAGAAPMQMPGGAPMPMASAGSAAMPTPPMTKP